MIDQKEIEILREKVGYIFQEDKMKDKMNRYITEGLFKEICYGRENRQPVLSTKDYDDGEHVSFKRIFVELGDPSGYLPAMVLLGSWDHWLKLCSNKRIFELITKATDELEVKLRAEALIEVRNISMSGKATALQAAKFLAEGKWKNTNLEQGSVGRPKKKDTAKELAKEEKLQEFMTAETEEDYQRIFGDSEYGNA